MSEEGYQKLVAELKQLESVERPKIVAAIAEARDKATCRKMQNTMLPRKLRACWK